MRTAVERLKAKLWENNMLTNDDLKLFEEAKEIEAYQATKYAEYCMKCDRIGVSPRSFDDWKKSREETEKEQKNSDYMPGWNDGYQNKVKNPLNDNPKSE